MVDWTPSDLGTSKCVAWFTADSLSSLSNGDSVSSWTSSEGNSISATQGTSANQPTYVASSTISGKPAVNFDGASSFDQLNFSASAMDVGTSGSLVCCFIGNANDGATLAFGTITRGQSSSNSIQLLYTNNNTSLQPSVGSVFDTISNSNFPSGTTGTDYRSIVFGRHSGNLMMRYIGNELSDQADASSIDLGQTNYAIGSAYFSGGCEGEIAEIMYLVNPTLKDIQKVEGYAAHKYSLTGSLPSDHPYKANAPQRAVDWTPSFLPAGNLAGWYKADAITGLSDGDAVDSWVDSSGNGNTLTQSTSGAKPSYETNELNSLPVVRFDKDASPGDNLLNADLGGDFEPGTGDFYIAMVAKFPTSATQFVMTKADSGDQGLNVFIFGGNNNFIFRPQTVGSTTNFLEQNSVVDTSFHTIVCRRVSSTLGSEFDGSAFTNDDGSKVNDGNLNNDASFNIGSKSDQSSDADMDLAEALVAVGTLTDDNLQRITGYLAHKYGLEANLPADHPYRHIKPIIKISNAFSSGLIDGGLIQA